MKMLRQNVKEEDDDEEVEGIKRPAQKSGCNRVPAIGTLVDFASQLSIHAILATYWVASKG